jgi:putative heme-binding domain-containing protein
MLPQRVFAELSRGLSLMIDRGAARIAVWLVKLCVLAGSLSAFVPRPSAAEEIVTEDRRVPWTTSTFKGEPDEPLPYVLEVAFPKLNFQHPLLITRAPGTRRLFVGDFHGKIVSFPEDPAVDHADLVIDFKRERPGADFVHYVYGVAFHPRFEENRYVYVCYILHPESADGSRISRFTMSRTDPPTIDPKSEKVILNWMSGCHNGCYLAFGHDGMLYAGLGDGHGPKPPDSLRTGQDISDLLSSILRIDVDHEDPGLPYHVPADNPFVKFPGARGEVWAYGLRNPWRMSFDRANGDLWVGDVGHEHWELVFRVERGANYGWSIREGSQPIHPDQKPGPTPIIPPTLQYSHTEGSSVTGGYVYRGTRFKDLVGTYLYGDWSSGKLWGLRHDGTKVTWQGELAATGLHIVAFGEAESGEIYVVEYDGKNQIYRLAPNTAPRSVDTFPRAISRSGLFRSAANLERASGVVPYAIKAEAWNDGTTSDRVVGIPGNEKITVARDGRWRLPDGSVLAKTISMERIARDPSSRRRMETQILHFEAGTSRPYTYAWNDEQTEATLVEPAGATRTITIQDSAAPGGRRDYAYRFASRSECVVCHNPGAHPGSVLVARQSAAPLAFNTAQLDRNGPSPFAGENQLQRFARLSFLNQALPPESATKIVDPYDPAADLSLRARSYLHANCVQCHQFNAGTSTDFSVAITDSLEKTKAIDGTPHKGTFGIDGAKIIAPGDADRSVLLYRIAKTGPGRMPRVGSQRVDDRGVKLIADWIGALPRSKTDPTAKPLTPQELAAAESLRSPSTPREVRLSSVKQLLNTTRGGLELARRISSGEVAEPAFVEIVELAKQNSHAEIRDLFERFLPDTEKVVRLGDKIDPQTILALTGDPARGREWFNSESATSCKSCHRIGGIGTELGPDLTTALAKYSKAELLGQILEPSKVVEPKFALYAIVTKDGQVHTGMVVSRTPKEVVLREALKPDLHIPVDDIEEEALRPGSIMPDGLFRDLTAQQAADLLEFLYSLRR